MTDGCYTYILECADGTLYAGWTNNLDNRIDVHNQGKGAKYTRSRLPVKLVASWKFPTSSEARSFEFRLKRLSRREKQKLIEQSSV